MKSRVRWIWLIYFFFIPCFVFAQINSVKLTDGVIKYYRVGEKSQSSFNYFLNSIQNYFLAGAKPFNKTVAFLVGVSKYDNMPNLPLVPQDIERLRDFLIKKGGIDTVFVASEEIVNEELIKRYMTSYFPDALNSDDRLIFFFSGHAGDNKGQTGYLLFKNSKPNEFWRNALPITETYEWSKVNRVKHLLFLYDCCSSGLAFASKGIDNDFEKILSSLSGKGSRIVITAGTANQKTYDGWFTTSLLNALNNNSKDVFITAQEIYNSIRNDIIGFSAKQGKELTPRMWELGAFGSYNGTFIFVNPNKVQKKLPLGLNVYLQSKSEIDEPSVISKSLPDLLNQIGKETNKLILLSHPTYISYSQFEWEFDLFRYAVNQYLKNNDKLIVFNDSILSDFRSDVTNTDTVYNHIRKLAIEVDSIVVTTQEVETRINSYTAYRATAKIELILNKGYVNEETRTLSFSQESNTRIKVINLIAEKFIESLDVLLLNNLPIRIPKVARINRNSIWIDKGFDQSFFEPAFKDVLDSVNLKPIAVVKIEQIEKDSSKLLTIYGHRMIKNGDIIHDRLNSYKGNSFMEFKFGQSTISDFNNISDNSTRDFKVDNYQLSFNKLFSVDLSDPYIGLNLKLVRNNIISLLGMSLKIGASYTFLPGFFKIGLAVDNGVFLLNYQNLPDTNKILISNYISIKPDWEINNELIGNSSFHSSVGIDMRYIIDRKEKFQTVTYFGYNITSHITSWKISYHTKETEGQGQYKESEMIKIPDKYVPLPNIFQSSLFWSIGFEYHFF